MRTIPMLFCPVRLHAHVQCMRVSMCTFVQNQTIFVVFSLTQSMFLTLLRESIVLVPLKAEI